MRRLQASKRAKAHYQGPLFCKGDACAGRGCQAKDERAACDGYDAAKEKLAEGYAATKEKVDGAFESEEGQQGRAGGS